jgi:hypothetical protein
LENNSRKPWDITENRHRDSLNKGREMMLLMMKMMMQ